MNKTELDHLNAADIGEAGAAQKLGQIGAELPGEAIMDEFHGRHAAADDALLVGQVELLGDRLIVLDLNAILLDIALGQPAQQRVDFILG